MACLTQVILKVFIPNPTAWPFKLLHNFLAISLVNFLLSLSKVIVILSVHNLLEHETCKSQKFYLVFAKFPPPASPPPLQHSPSQIIHVCKHRQYSALTEKYKRASLVLQWEQCINYKILFQIHTRSKIIQARLVHNCAHQLFIIVP